MGLRRITAIIGLLFVAAGSAAGLAGGLVSCGSGTAAAGAGQPVNAAQAGRLAMARLANRQDAQAGFRAVIHAPGGDVRLTGWVDWARPLTYLNSAAEQSGAADGLVQAVPGVVAVHAGRYPQPGSTASPGGGIDAGSTEEYPAAPPSPPPTDGWRIREMNPLAGASAFDGLLALLFSLAATAPDDATAILSAGRTTVHPASLAGVAAQVYTGPALTTPLISPAGSTTTGPVPTPTASAPAAAMPPVDGAVQYWLDGSGRMLRVAASLGSDLPVQVDFTRSVEQSLVTVPALGGAAITPRALTEDELRLVSRMRARDRQSGGGTVALVLPINPAGLTTATGWLDWHTAVGYLALHNPDDPGADQLVRLEQAGLASRAGAMDTDPPLKPPTDGWHYSAWAGRGDAGGATDLDILLSQAVTMTGTRYDSLDDLRANASFLRTDALAGVPVLVIEIRQASESGAVPGSGRLRYWMDQEGLLRRIEVRTRQGGYGSLDITPAPVPALPDPHTT